MMDFSSMASALGFEKDDFIELAGLLVTTSLSDLETLEKGIAAGDPSLVAQAAHSIKGAAGNLGFMEISAVAAEAEASARKGSLNGVKDRIKSIRTGLEAITKAI